MKILILGASGFLGSNLLEELVDDDKYYIITFDLGLRKVLKNLVKDNIKFYFGNFNNEKDIRNIFDSNDIHIVIHLISTTIPSTSNNDITHDIDSNLISTVRLLEIMREYKVLKIIFLSSGGTIYGIPENLPVMEEASTNPICSHGIVKLTIEKYILLYNYLYGFDYLILRVANLYGENHSSAELGLINVVLRKLIKNEDIKIWGDGSIIRDYVYVKDLTRIIKLLIEKNIWNQTLNIGTGEGHSINEILNLIRERINYFNVEYLSFRKFDIPNLVLSNTKLRSIIDFNFTHIEEGIIKTYNWIKKNV